jgi:transaldolase / glucose-6-phosphate isomerase
MINRLKQIASLGQAILLDNLSRELLYSGELRELIFAGVTGVTSNPSIWQKAVATGSHYDTQIQALAQAGHTAHEIYEAIAAQDIAMAADQLRPVYNETHGRDGFVSLEVNPALAHDTAATIAEGRRLFETVHRPNVMIKVPATPEVMPAITALIGAGVNVNVTLIFAIPVYEQVMQAYLAGLRQLHAARRPLPSVSSVASFFVSRVDTMVDTRLAEVQERTGDDKLEGLKGRAAIANAKVAYTRFRAMVTSNEFNELRSLGARVQRPLWASTSTKNPDYPPTKYVDNLIGPNTVNTVPPETLAAIAEHATVAQTLEVEVDQACAVMERIKQAGINFDEVTGQLLAEGVRLFAKSFDKLIEGIEAKRAAVEAVAPGA